MGAGSQIKSTTENIFYKNPQFYFVWKTVLNLKKYIACFIFSNIILHQGFSTFFS